MKKSILFSAVTSMSFLLVLILMSCSSGLEPSWKNAHRSVFSLDFSTSLRSSSLESRALVQGGGFLYIRTIGGPLGENGSFYGPYSVAQGSVFSTTEIPAGTYDSMAIIYAGTQPGAVHVGPYTFLELMTLPDETFLATIHSENFQMQNYFDSNASAKITDNVTLIAGRENSIRLTLEPLVRSENRKYFPSVDGQPAVTISNVGLETTSLKKQFFTLQQAPSGVFSCHIPPLSSVGTTALYDSNGKLLKSWAANTLDRRCDLPDYEGTKNLYFYAEYSAEANLAFTITLPEVGGGQIQEKEYFVSNAGGGDGTGGNPVTLDAVFGLINNDTSSAAYVVYITEFLTYDGSVTLNVIPAKQIRIQSFTGHHTISLKSFPDKIPFDINDNTFVTFENLTVDGAQSPILSKSAFSVEPFGTLVLKNTVIKNMKNTGTGEGGAVRLKNGGGNGGILNMNSSTIEYCSAIKGGGIYAESNSKIYVSADTKINNSTAEISGGGIHLVTGAKIFTAPEPPNVPVELTTEEEVITWAPLITENTAGIPEDPSNVYFQ